MTHPRHFAKSTPDKPAIVMSGSGRTITFKALEDSANQVAHLFRSQGIQAGEKVAFVLENCPEVYEMAWGAQRSGICFVPISSRLTADEIEYIVRDSGARMLLASDYLGKSLDDVEQRLRDDIKLFKTGAPKGAWKSWEASVGAQPTSPIADETRGFDMLYSSGTTGRPKGIVPIPPDDNDNAIDAEDVLTQFVQLLFGGSDKSIYLCPAPLYHAAPLRWTMSVTKLGGTVLVMEKFDAEDALRLIEQYKVTIGQFVPTHFVRMLKLPEDVRAKYDVSSITCAVHAAAPCPVPIKEQMIDWWGPVISEYYAGSEGSGMTMVNSPEWLTHKGTVGRAIRGEVRICDEDGNVLPARQEGMVFFEGGGEYSYHNDPAKTADSHNRHGWSTLGDIGWQDEEGYLYLTDRKSFMIISGGVNIYPQEIENLLITHPKVADVAVIGAPDSEMGEKVVAIIQPHSMADATDATKDELYAFCREHLSGVKTPRQFDFREELPRAATGKLYKRLLRDEYWKDAKSA